MRTWRIPEEVPLKVLVLVVRKHGEMTVAEKLSRHWLGPMGTVFNDVVAWMPLPEYDPEEVGK